MYAVIQTSGRQYKVAVGDQIDVDRVGAEPGTDLTLDQVLLLGGSGVKVGAPTIPGAAVTARVVEHFLADKRVTVKYRRRQRSRRKVGYRPAMTRIEITGITEA
jgi:large subunit ribosomal protein L21